MVQNMEGTAKLRLELDPLLKIRGVIGMFLLELMTWVRGGGKGVAY